MNNSKIDKNNVEDILPLTSMQEGMLFYYINNPNSKEYHEQLSLTLVGNIKFNLIKKSWEYVIKYNEMLRTIYKWNKLEKPIQIILKEQKLNIQEYDLSKNEESKKVELLNKIREEDLNKQIDIANNTLRIILCKLEENKSEMIISNHHIIYDGWSNGIILKEFIYAYECYYNQEKPKIINKNKFREFIKWDKSQNKKKQKKYWENYLQGIENKRNFYNYNEKSDNKCIKIEKSKLSKEVSENLKKYTQKNKISLAALMYSIWGILEQRYKNTNDVTFGTTVSGRVPEIKGIENMVGLFINTIPLRITHKHNDKIINIIKMVEKNLREREEYERTSLVDINNYANLSGNEDLFDSIVVIENYPLEKVFNNKSLINIQNYSMFERTNYDLSLVINCFDNIELNLVYNNCKFQNKFIKSMLNNFINILDKIINNEVIKLSEIEILSEEEKNKILYEFNDTKVDYSNNKTMQELFEKQVEKTPNNTAVIYEDKKLTYKELNERANSLARVLREKGVKQDEIVGIMTKRSLEMVIGMISILKAGGAYLPINPEYPQDRIEYMLDDSKTNILLTQSGFIEKTKFDGQVINVEESKFYENNTENLKNINNSEDLAYVIYTSGTTGKPKGVLIEHRSIFETIKWRSKEYDFKETDVILPIVNYSFDGFVTTFFTPIMCGSKVVLTRDEDMKDIFKLKYLIQRYKVTHYASVPLIYSQLLSILTHRDAESLKVVTLAGERVPYEVVKETYKMNKNIEVINEYGPTENTVITTMMRDVQKCNKVLIGKPKANSKIYILNKNNKLQPIGMPGEICISGNGLARGYLNRPKLTKEKFIQNPIESGQRMYKTGDLARWLPDGNIEFLGRVDNQVKIRGFRIELGEIENSLLKHENIEEAVVIDREDNNRNKYLCAYIISDKELIFKDLKESLLKELPDYMIPSYFMQIEKMPLTVNGKIDKKALPEPSKDITNISYEPPRNDIEEKMTKIWSKVLGIKKIGINDNFFDLGGDSIKAIRVISKLQSFGYKLEIKDLFKYSNIKELSSRISCIKKVISQDLVKGKAELIPIQKWFFDNEFKDMHHFNQTVMLYRKEGFNEEILQKVFDKIVQHHDALRMVYKKENDKVIQFNRGLQGELYTLETFDYSELKDFKEKINEKCNKIQSSIDLTKGPLVKLGLFKTKEGDHLLIAIHHLVVDGISWRILFEDFELAYNQVLNGEKVVFQDKTNSYKEWSEYVKEYSQSKDMDKEAKYWNKIENIEVKSLPEDREIKDEEKVMKNCENLVVMLDEKNTENLLKNVNKAYNTEINDVLLTALGLTMKQWSGQDEVLVNLEGHGREKLKGDIDVSRTIGWFTTQYPVIVDIPKSDIGYAIKNTKEILRHIPNKGIGYGILKYSQKDKLKCNLKPEISFNYLGQFDEDVKNEIFEVSQLSKNDSISVNFKNLYKMILNLVVSQGKLNIVFTYNKKQYNKDTIENLGRTYKENLCEIIKQCVNKNDAECTPTDLGDDELTLEELKYLNDKYKQFKIKNVYKLTPMQEGMLFHTLKDSNSSVYFEQTVLTLKGNIDVEIFEKSFNKLLERYDILRTVFVCENVKEPRQVVFKERKGKIYYEDITKVKDKKKYGDEYIQKDKEKGFNLSKDLLMRVSILREEDKVYKVVWSFHHILMDGWCLSIIMKDFFDIYSCLKNNKQLNLSKVEPYINYINWLSKQEKTEAKQYWTKYLDGYDTKAEVPKNNYVVDKYKLKEKKFIIDEEITSKLNEISRKAKVTVNTIIQGIWGLLLQRYNNTDDVVFGSVVSGRNADVKGIEEIVGLFINTVPIRVKNKKNISFIDLIKDLQKSSLNCRNYDYYPLSQIQSNTGIKQGLVNNILIFENYYMSGSLKELDKGKLGFTVEDFHNHEQTNYDFNIVVVPGSKLNVNLSFNELVYKSEFVDKISKHFEKAIKEVIKNPQVNLNEIEIVTEEDRNKILYEFNDTKVDYPKDKTIYQLFEQQVEKTPNNIAAIYEDKKLTYKELNERSNSLARVLRQKGVKQDKIVGIMTKRSLEMIVGIMAILKAGGAYLPIDPEYPQDRIEYMLRDSGSNLVLTQKDLMKRFNEIKFDGQVINLEESKFYRNNTENLKNINNSKDLAYVIYTSGTTGKPKGVLIEHRSIFETIQWRKLEYNLSIRDKILNVFNFVFDGFLTSVFTSLVSGCELILLKDENARDIYAIKECIAKNKVTHFICVPSLYNGILQVLSKEEAKSLKIITLAGESVSSNIINYSKTKNTQVELVNEYGPTENTVVTTVKRNIQKESEISIGKPIANTKVYILNKNNKLQPIGIKGELCISGNGLARGYLNREDLTKEKFIENPFISGERLYKTGDLARWLPDGNIEFLGRVDEQVKIRGFRIELGEIENSLLKHENIKEAVVIDRKDKYNNKYLCAYVVCDKKLNIKEFREHLLKELPKYMVPSYFIYLDKIPLTMNGKIDKKALPEPDGSINIETEYEAPRNEVEQKLTEVWQEVLGIKKVGINDNFFDLGGDSIKAIRVISKLQSFGYKLEIKDLFKYSNIKELSGRISYSKKVINQELVEGKVELMPIQKWFFDNEFKDMHHFNQAVMLYRKEGFDKEILQKVFNKIVHHHDALRMIYKKENDKVIQFNRGLEGELYTLKTFDYSKVEDYKEKINEKCNKIQSSIDLNKGPLIKLGLFKTKQGDHLLIAIHHLVVDGMSWRILFEDFALLYNQVLNGEEIVLQDKTNSYKEWSECVKEYSQSKEIDKEVKYWNNIESIEVKSLPKDREINNEEKVMKNCENVVMILDEENTKNLLRNVNKAYNTEINDVLLTALGLTIKQWCGQDKTLINLEGHGREELNINGDIDVNRTIGWFTTQYPVIIDVPKLDVGYGLKNTKEILRHIPNKGIGYCILKYLQKNKLKYNLKPEISFNYLGQFDEDIKNEIFEMSNLSLGDSTSTDCKNLFAVNINGIVSQEKLKMIFTYNNKEYNKDTIENLGKIYIENLSRIIKHCINKDETECTPTDLGDNELTLEELEYLLDKYKEFKIKNVYRLTPMQEGMLFHTLKDSNSSAYFEQTVLTLKGDINVDIFEKSFNKLLERYDILRTVFVYEKIKEPRQIVFKERKGKVYYEDITNLKDKKKYEDEYIQKDKEAGFNLSRDLLMRVSILKEEDKVCKVVWSFHHILMDGWCLSIIMKDFFDIYSSLKNNKKLDLPKVEPYINYINWLSKQDKEESKEYWRQYLKEYDTKAEVPKQKSASNKYQLEEIQFTIDEKITDNINKISRKNKITVNTIIQEIWGLLLQQYNNTDDVVFGTVVSGRNADVAGIEEMVGLFINTVPVRVKNKKDVRFIDLAKELQKSSLNCRNYDYYPLSQIQSNTDVKQGLINNIVVFENYYMDSNLNDIKKEKIGFIIENIHNYEQTNYDFNIVVVPESKLQLNLSFNKSVYNYEFVDRVGKHFEKVIKQVVENPEIKLNEIEIITQEEKNKVLCEFNDTKLDYPKDKTIHQLFEEQVQKTPDNIALVYKDKKLTYRELNERANSLARVLRKKGVKQDTIVGIMVERSLEMIVGILAILKSGGAYLPIDSEYPEDRIKYMLSDSAVDLVLIQGNLINIMNEIKFDEHVIDLEDSKLYENNTENLKNINSSSDLAYVMYTSGSTGKPKGTLIMHYNAIRVVKNTNYIDIREKDGILQLSNYAFDGSTFDIYSALLNGAKLILVSKQSVLNVNKLSEIIKEENIKVFFITTALFNVLVDTQIDCLKNVRKVLFGGQGISVSHARKALECLGKGKLIHVYGPTESTVFTTYYFIDEIDKNSFNIPIGKPIGNTKVYILNKNNKLQSIGAAGELCISGDGLARGYLNRENLTKEKFIENPFEPGEKLYKTGDLARWLPDGNVEFLGRIDNQVKVRGFRIEIGEIENVLLKYKDIKETIVIDKKGTDGNKYLCSYVVSNKELNIKKIKEFLLKRLPEYMVPAYFIQLNKMPLTLNGKVNKKALPEPNENINTEEEYEVPRNEVEQKLTEVWQEVLGIKKVGINDNFFNLGGDSIKAIRVISKLQNFGYKLEIKDLFKYSNIKQLSNRISYSKKIINQDLVEGEVQLIPIQKWFFDNKFKDMHYFNQAVMLYRKEGFDKEILQKVFDKILKHHDALRMVYKKENDKVIQFNRGLEGELYTLETFDYGEIEDYKEKINEKCIEIQSSINLIKGPLIKLGLFKTKEGDHLLIAIHHLVVDGVSWRILFEDFALAYNQVLNREKIILQDKTNSYKEWSKYVKKYSQSKEIDKEAEYWNKIESIKVKFLPKDREIKDEEKVMKNCKNVVVTLDEKSTENLLRNVNKAYNTEINDVLLTALGLTMKQWSGQDKVLVNLEGHGREKLNGDIDVSRTIGWFTTQYPVIIDIPKSDLGYVIKNTKEMLRHIPNKGIGYGILKYLQKDKLKCNLKPEISFNYLGQFDEDIKNSIFNLSKLTGGLASSENSKNLYSFNINAVIVQNKLNITLTYNKKEYNKKSIEKLVQTFKKNLCNVIEHCVGKKETECTPTDLGDNELTLEELEYLLEEYKEFKIKNIYRLTPMQEGMLFHTLKDSNSSVYFEQTVLTLKGDIDVDIFEKSFNKLLERYDILRTVFACENIKEPRQIVFKNRKAKIYYEDITNLKDKKKYEDEYIQKDKDKGFNLSEDLLIRVSILREQDKVYKVVWSFHHILMDGWCLSIIMKDFFYIYSCLKNNKQLNLPKVESYMNYINWLSKQDKQEAKEYWRRYLEDYDTKAEVPKQNHISDKYKLKEIEFDIDEQMTNKINEISRESKVTVNTILQGIWGILLQRYNNTDDVVFGSVVSGRNADVTGIEEMVGLFINTIPVRVKGEKDIRFIDLAKKLQKNSLNCRNCDYCSLSEIQSNTDVKQGLIDNIFVFENYYMNNDLKGINEKEIGFVIENGYNHEQTNYNFNVIIVPGSKLKVNLSFNELVYSSEFIDKVSKHFDKAIKEVIRNPQIKVNQIDIITKEEKNKILYEFNDTKLDYPKDKTIHQLFEEQVQKTPDNVAVVYKDKKLTYRELNERANSLARVLRKKGVKQDTIVGIMVERSLDMIVGVMGILKAGGAYLPIDPNYPKQRIEYMIKDSGSDVLLSRKNLLKNIDFTRNFIDLSDESLFNGKSNDLEQMSNSSNLAYIIYTSGTTGNPKGVMVEHKSLVNLSYYHNKKFNVTYKDNATIYASFSFDACVWEIWPYMIVGASLYIISNSLKLNIEELNKYYERNNITITFLPTQVYETIRHMKNNFLRLVLTGGDKLNYYNPNKFKLFNNYGPTEATVVATNYEVDKLRKNIPIGKPISNTRVYILNENNKLQPIGTAGELCISGDGLARGYLNREDLTKEKFIENPFEPGEKLYKTGDLARWLPDGNIEFLGRIDNQVKVRGFRIEIGEIENVLLKYEDIKEAIVIDRKGTDGNKYLCSYIVSDKDLNIKKIKEFLLKRLPEYMIPTYFMQINKMPLTLNGKVDKKLLPEPDGTINAEEEYEAPRNEIEEKLVEIWKEVLGVCKVGINDNFFDLGGHSLKATVLVSKIHKELNTQIPIKEIFRVPTIKGISKYIKNVDKNMYSNIEKVEEKEYYEVSSAQKRVYTVQQLDLESTTYNIPLVLEIEGKIDRNKLEKVFNDLIVRHEAFRTSFEVKDGEIVQRIYNNVKFSIDYIDNIASEQVAAEKEELCLIKNYKTQNNEETNNILNNVDRIVCNFIKPFNLSKAPLLRVLLVKLSEKKHVIVLDMHHIISDGVSMGIFTKEFGELYEGKKLKPLRIQYKDFAAWQNKLLKSEKLKEQEKYWLEKFSGEIPVLNMPYDYERPAVQSFKGDRVNFKIDKETTKKLQTLAKQTGSTMYMILLSAYNILLSKYSGQEDIIIGSPIAGRNHDDLNNAIGMFVNTLAMRNYPKGNKVYIQFLKEVKENCLKAYENQDYQFEELVNKLNIIRDKSRNILFDVMFAMENVEIDELDIKDFKLKTYETEIKSKISKFDLTLIAEERKGEIELQLEYCTKLFTDNTIMDMVDRYKEILSCIIENPNIKIHEINIDNSLVAVDSFKDDEEVDFNF